MVGEGVDRPAPGAVRRGAHTDLFAQLGVKARVAIFDER